MGNPQAAAAELESLRQVLAQNQDLAFHGGEAAIRNRIRGLEAQFSAAPTPPSNGVPSAPQTGATASTGTTPATSPNGTPPVAPGTAPGTTLGLSVQSRVNALLGKLQI